MRRAQWALAALAAVAVLAGGLANHADRTYVETGWHTVVRGEEEADVEVGNFQVHVHGATASTELDDRDLLTSPAMFLVVDLSYASTDAWSMPEEIVLIDGDGREFTNPGGFGFTGSPWRVGPDIWFRGDLLFEVPLESVDSLALEFRPETVNALLPDSVARIPLTVSQSTEPLLLEYPAVLGEGER